jgi:hypothetical protein
MTHVPKPSRQQQTYAQGAHNITRKGQWAGANYNLNRTQRHMQRSKTSCSKDEIKQSQSPEVDMDIFDVDFDMSARSRASQ